MSLPSRSEFSPALSASLLHNSRCTTWVVLSPRPHGRFESCSPHTSRCPGDCAPSWSFRALRRSFRCSDSANSTCVSLTTTRLTSPGSATSSGFPSPSTLHSASASPTLFRVGVAPGLPLFLRRFLPVRSPGSLSARGVLHVVVSFGFLAVTALDRLRGCQHRLDALSSPRGFSALRRSLLPWSFSPSRC
jgi:hypothetical protein